jgi:hypothetical protein
MSANAYVIEQEVQYDFDPQCAPEQPRKIEWASSCPSEPADRPIRSNRNCTLNQKLLSLPRFKNVDILDLIRLAEESGLRVSDRASAIAVLVGNDSLDSPKFQLPLVVALGPGMPKYL